MTADGQIHPRPVEEVLRKTSAFHEVKDSVLKEVSRVSKIKKFDKEDVVFEIGGESDGLYIVVSGRIGITCLFVDGKEIILNILEEGEVFGEVGAIDNLPRTAGAVAMEAAELLHIDGLEFRRLIHRHPVLCYGLMSVLCSRVRWTSSIIEDAVFRDVRARLAKRLLLLADLYGTPTEDGTRIEIKITHNHLGRMLGITRESITKESVFLRDNHAVSYHRGSFIIRDRGYLERLAALT